MGHMTIIIFSINKKVYKKAFKGFCPRILIAITISIAKTTETVKLVKTKPIDKGFSIPANEKEKRTCATVSSKKK